MKRCRTSILALLFCVPCSFCATPAKPTPPPVLPHVQSLPVMIEADGKLRFDFTEEKVVLSGGLQPFVWGMKSGALLVQAQEPRNPHPSQRMTYPRMLGTVVTRDGGKNWTPIPLKDGDNGVNVEGGITQLPDGTILALDTYITPTDQPGVLTGLLYTSRDEWRTLDAPEEVRFEIPGVIFPSSDDGGRPHQAQRLHRRIVALPGGDLLATAYGWLEGDTKPSTYEPRMMRTRSMLLRSADRGRNWRLVSSIAPDTTVGTEGFAEPVLVRISTGPNAGRLRCYMRTGRALHECFSDDEGKTWSAPKLLVLGGVDVNRTELWVDMFRDITGARGLKLDENNPDELRGSVVNPDVVELRSGLLALSFGVRIPQKASLPHMKLQFDVRHPWNGNYLAISSDHGETWSNVIRLTSGVATTHNMGLEATAKDNEVFVCYDLLYSGTRARRDAWGRFVTITEKSAR